MVLVELVGVLELVTVVVLIEVLVGLVLDFEVELVEVLWVVVELEQSRLASSLRVVAPWPRLLVRVELIVDGRAATWLWNAWAAPRAPPQRPAPTAEETALSLELRLSACGPESSPVPPPQATTKATAKPRLPARNARGLRPIGA